MAVFKHFRVYPEAGSKLYFQVRVFASRRGFQRYYRLPPRTLAFASATRRLDPNTDRLSPLLGWVGFYKTGVSHETVAHEMVHAALFYLYRKKIKSLAWDENHNKLEERICYIVGTLVSQFYRKANRRRLL